MSFYRDVTAKPWLSPGLADDAQAEPAFDTDSEKVALSFLMGAIGILFSLLVVSFIMRRGMSGDWVSVSVPSLLWINTGILVLSSLAFQLAVSHVRRDYSVAGLSWRLVLAGLLALVFIAGQAALWQQLAAAGHTIANNPASGFFYLLTGVHVAHLLGGLWVWSKTLFRLGRAERAANVRLSVELCATYWHFLLAVWLVLLYLLATN